jgi:hypothetical protein
MDSHVAIIAICISAKCQIKGGPRQLAHRSFGIDYPLLDDLGDGYTETDSPIAHATR